MPTPNLVRTEVVQVPITLITHTTGELCPACDAPSYFVPGYLTTDVASGVKRFTVARRTDHTSQCDEWKRILTD